MRHIVLFLFAVVTSVMSSSAQVPAMEAKKGNKIVDSKFVLVASSLAVSTIWDVETTFMAIKTHGGVEGNPLLKRFVRTGRPATYALLGAVDACIVYVAYRTKQGTTTNRKYWWVVPTASTTGHAIAGGFNLRFFFY